MADVLVTGGTGVLGTRVVSVLEVRGHAVRVLSRRGATAGKSGGDRGTRRVRGDLASGAGLSEAVAGVDAVVHCASATGTLRRRSLREVDVEGTRRLAAAARAAGRPHLLYPSIVGIDDVPFVYYRTKRAAEVEIERSALPWTVLRATQFHELLHLGLQALHRGPLLLLPRGFRFQPVAAGEVAERLVALLEQGDTGRAGDLGGPQELSAAELATAYLGARSGRLPRVVPVPVPGRTARAIRSGSLLCPGCDTGKVSFVEFLGRVG